MFKAILKQRRPRDLLLLFELLAIFLLFIINNQHIDRYIAILFFGLISVIYISNLILGRITSGDNYIFLIVSMLLSLGIITIFRLKPKLGIQQLVWSLVGILVFYMTYFAMRALRNIQKWTNLYVLIALFLFLITFVFGSEKSGAKNWILIGDSISFQPSEFTKIILMFLIASFYSDYQYKLKKESRSYFLLGIVYLLVIMLFLQRDLGTAVIFLAIYTIVQFIYDENRKSIWVNIGLMCAGAILGTLLFAHVRTRIDIWLNPWDPDKIYKSSSQIIQSLFAIAEGGFFGTGIGVGHPNLVPVGYSDFIFPIICEEMGIFTGIGIIMLFMLLTYRGIKIAISQEQKFYRILAICCSTLFAVQCFLNIGGVIKLIPMTGLTLPFVSYGGSSMISSFIALGILQVTSEDMSYKYE